MDKPVAIALFSVVLSGCAQIVKDAGFPEVQSVVSERLGQNLHWDQGRPEDEAARGKVRELLAQELSADAAVQIALLNNPSLQATYEELGIAQAELVQAGLLRNPIFEARARFPDRPPSAANIELGIVQDFLDVLMLPARKRLGEAQFQETQLRISNEVFALTGEVRSAYYSLVAAQQTTAVMREVAEVAQVAYDLAKKFHEAGNIDDLSLANEQALYEQARLELAKSEAEVRRNREQVNILMGLWGTDIDCRTPERLPELPSEDTGLDHLESLAIAQRLDLAAAGKQVETLAQALGITRDWRYLATAEIGVNSERDTDRQIVTGPTLSLEVPLFDRREAKIARGEASLRQAEKRLRALAIKIRSEVRGTRDRMLTARNLIGHYQSTLVPLRERIVELSQEQYNYMLIGAADVLLAKQNAITGYRDYVAAYREYWTARSDLEAAVGGRLPGTDGDARTSKSEARTPSSAHVHHGGHSHVESP